MGTRAAAAEIRGCWRWWLDDFGGAQGVQQGNKLRRVRGGCRSISDIFSDHRPALSETIGHRALAAQRQSDCGPFVHIPANEPTNTEHLNYSASSSNWQPADVRRQ